jgi:hypothetical protein
MFKTISSCRERSTFKMEPIHLNKRQARRILLKHQGLWPPYQLTDKAEIVNFIQRVGCIQYDPLNIVGNNPELVLQARVKNFQPDMLQELLYQDRLLVDGWDKMMSIYPVEDWPYFNRYREAARRRLGDSSTPVATVLPQVRNAIEQQGPLSSIDLDFDQVVDWFWAPTRLARAALESMHAWGELIIHHRVHTRKVYDFANRHIPEKLLSAPDPNEIEQQYHDWYVLRRIGSLGLVWNKAGDAWLGMRSIKSKQRNEALARLLERGKVIPVDIEDMNESFYIRSEDRHTLEQVITYDPPDPRAVILAPLDNLLWDRRLVEALFDFYYRWEVYKPAAERRYGYYVLPVLYGDRFVARFEPGRDKASGALVIKNWWWEREINPSPKLLSELNNCFLRFLEYLGTDTLKIDPSSAAESGLDWLEYNTR